MSRDLGPVRLVEPRGAAWAERFAAVSALVGATLRDAHVEHIGSTAVPDFPAKDAVDVLVGVAGAVEEAVSALQRAGLQLDGIRPGHAWMWAEVDLRSEDASGGAVAHVVPHGGEMWVARLAFRDILRRDARARADYLAAKRAAASDNADWRAYTRAKHATVVRLLGSRRSG